MILKRGYTLIKTQSQNIVKSHSLRDTNVIIWFTMKDLIMLGMQEIERFSLKSGVESRKKN